MRPLLTRLSLAAALLLVACAGAPPVPPVLPPQGPDALGHDLAIHAVGLVGTPYRWGGNTPDGGFDCSGLIAYVYRRQVGVVPPRTVAQLADFGQAVDARSLRTGDLLVFGTDPAWHAGIYVGEGRFVHAPSTGGTVRLDRLDSPYWSRQPWRVRRP